MVSKKMMISVLVASTLSLYAGGERTERNVTLKEPQVLEALTIIGSAMRDCPIVDRPKGSSNLTSVLRNIRGKQNGFEGVSEHVQRQANDFLYKEVTEELPAEDMILRAGALPSTVVGEDFYLPGGALQNISYAVSPHAWRAVPLTADGEEAALKERVGEQVTALLENYDRDGEGSNLERLKRVYERGEVVSKDIRSNAAHLYFAVAIREANERGQRFLPGDGTFVVPENQCQSAGDLPGNSRRGSIAGEAAPVRPRRFSWLRRGASVAAFGGAAYAGKQAYNHFRDGYKLYRMQKKLSSPEKVRLFIERAKREKGLSEEEAHKMWRTLKRTLKGSYWKRAGKGLQYTLASLLTGYLGYSYW